MITFFVAAAVMLAGALSFVLPTLLRKERSAAVSARRNDLNLDVLRDQLRELDADRLGGAINDADYASARQELERRVVEDVRPEAVASVAPGGKRWVAVLAGIAMPALAVGLYVLLGNPSALNPQLAVQDDQAHAVNAGQINAMVDKLANHLKEKPEDVEGWGMLARSYNTLGRFADAADAYAHLEKLVPPNADLLADHADSLAMAQNKSLFGEPEKMIERALVLDPNHVKALALSGGVAFERKDYRRAIAQWKKLQPLVTQDSDMAQSVASSIAEAEQLAGMPVSAAQVGSGADGGANAGKNAVQANASGEVSGTVELDPALRSKVSDTDTVFIFARAANGPRFPLAVLRKQVKDLPAKFALDDSMSMMPDAKLSGFPLLIVGARISKTGSATPGPGDLEGVIEQVRNGAKGLNIHISTQRQ